MLRRVLNFSLMESETEFMDQYQKTFLLLSQVTDIIILEISSAFKDLDYWYQISEVAYRVDSRGNMWYEWFLVRNGSVYITQNFTPTITRLQQIIHNLSSNLCCLNQAAVYLKVIYILLIKNGDRMEQIDIPRDNNSEVPSSPSRSKLQSKQSTLSSLLNALSPMTTLRSDSTQTLLSIDTTSPTRDKIQEAKQYLAKSLVIAQAVCENLLAESALPLALRLDEVHSTSVFDHTLLASLRRAEELLNDCITLQKSHRLDVVPKALRRPNQMNLKYLILGTLASLSAVALTRMAISGQLQRIVTNLVVVAKAFFWEHVLEPMRILCGEFFDTLRHRDAIVSRADLEQSNRALTRMLEDYAATHHIAVAAGSHGDGAAGGGDSSLREQAMEQLMRKYESELRAPVKGLVFGSLMTAMLIQMQKLKVHTEAAMLTMDQILTSNELTMAATAAMPALALLGGTLYLLSGVLLSQPNLAPRTSGRKLRLALVEVERALSDVHWPADYSNLSRLVQDSQEGSSVLQRQASKGMAIYRILRLYKAVSNATAALLPGSGRIIGSRSPSSHTGVGMEQESLYRDLLDLLSPDFEIPIDRKLATVNRMRSSYQVLTPPRL